MKNEIESVDTGLILTPIILIAGMERRSCVYYHLPLDISQEIYPISTDSKLAPLPIILALDTCARMETRISNQ